MQSFRIAMPLLSSCRLQVSHSCTCSLFRTARWDTQRAIAKGLLKVQRPTASSCVRSSLHFSTVSCSAETKGNSSTTEASQAPSWPSRNAHCGQQTLQHEGKRLELCGWVHRARNMGGIVFADLRDHSGILQVRFLLVTLPLLRCMLLGERLPAKLSLP